MDERERRAEYWVQNYADTLVRLGWTWFGNPHDAQDICQTVLLKLMEHDPGLPDRDAERAWVLRVAVNVCKDLKRNAWNRRTVGLEACQVTVPPPGEGSGLLEAVGRLPRTYRQVVYLRYYEGYGVSEIAEMLAVKPALVSTRLARARTKLKNMMGGGQNEGTISE